MELPRSISTMSVGRAGGRRNKFAASTVPENPAPTITRVFRMVEKSTKPPAYEGVRGVASSANIWQTWSNGPLLRARGSDGTQQQIHLLLRLRGVSHRDCRVGGHQFAPRDA